MKIKLTRRPVSATQIRFCTKENREKDLKDFEGNRNEIVVRYQGDATRIWCGLGEGKKCTAAVIRSAAAAAFQKARDLKRASAALIGPEVPGIDRAAAGRAALEGALLGSYSFSRYKTEKPAVTGTLELAGTAFTREEVRYTEALCGCVAYARDLVNDNASVTTPAYFAAEARRLAGRRTRTTVLTEREIARKGLNLLGAVGQGSPYPPRLIFIQYRGAPKSKENVAVVGKGITFDSGGINLKQSGGIENMRCSVS
jgi:leucyl aminopeptidase